MRQARLEAAACRYQLEQARGELADLRLQVTALAHPQRGRDVGAGSAAAAQWEEALQAARLEATDNKYKLQLTELELAKQLDALQELQWQLECVVCQLGLAPPSGSAAAGPAAAASAAAAVAAPAATPAPPIDHMLLLAKVEELRSAQVQLAECQRRLAQAEAALAAAEARSAAGQQGAPGVAVPAAAAAHPAADGSIPLGTGGQELVGCLLGENVQLRARLAEAEVRGKWKGSCKLTAKCDSMHGTARRVNACCW